MREQFRSLFTSLAAATLLLGCGTPGSQPVPPPPADTSFQPQAVDKIYVAALVHAPADPALQAEFKQPIRKWVKEYLERKHYRCEVAQRDSQVTGATQEDLQRRKPAWLDQAAGGEGRWVLVLATGEMRKERNSEFGGLNIDGTLELAGWLLDRQAGEVVWHYTTRGFYSGGSAIAGFTTHHAMYNLMVRFPAKPVGQ
jgi:hypothetical protein